LPRRKRRHASTDQQDYQQESNRHWRSRAGHGESPRQSSRRRILNYGPPAYQEGAAFDGVFARFGLIDRSTFEVWSRPDAIVYSCYPRLVNGYL
jgi:hypothetical protein